MKTSSALVLCEVLSAGLEATALRQARRPPLHSLLIHLADCERTIKNDLDDIAYCLSKEMRKLYLEHVQDIHN